MSEQRGVKWAVCRVLGSVSTVNSGFISSSPSTRELKRREIKVGMNLASHDTDLPAVVVKGIGEDFLVVHSGGVTATVYTGGFYRSPRKGLSYAFSDVNICLK